MVDLDQRCGICRLPKGKHWVTAGPRYQCPVETFFTPCLHRNRQGIGAIGTAGMSYSDTTCMDCGDRIVFGTPPDSQSDAGADLG